MSDIETTLPSLDILNAMFVYKDGRLIKTAWPVPHREGEYADIPRYDGYCRVGVGKKRFFAHRIIYAMHHGDPGDLVIDHIDRNHSNNRIENLRAVSTRVNILNAPDTARKNNKCGFRGVMFIKGKYLALIMHKGKTIRLGTYDTPEQANDVYEIVRQGLHFNDKESLEYYYDLIEKLEIKKKAPRSLTGYKSIKYIKNSDKYEINIYNGGRKYYLGRFKTLEEAVSVRENWLKEHEMR